LFDPVTGRFSYAGRMQTPREGHTATRLSDGRVLMTGGVEFHGGDSHPVTTVVLSSAELYVSPGAVPAIRPH
jgi:hypothetical protein